MVVPQAPSGITVDPVRDIFPPNFLPINASSLGEKSEVLLIWEPFLSIIVRLGMGICAAEASARAKVKHWDGECR